MKLDQMGLEWFPSKEAWDMSQSKNASVSTEYACRTPTRPKKIKPIIANFYEGTTINVTCKILSGYPTPHVFWTTPQNKTYYSSDGRLVIEDKPDKNGRKTRRDGDYICQNVNIVGSVHIKYVSVAL